MRITSQNTDETVLAELGSRLAKTRLERNLTQEQVAAEAGIGLATLERIESGRPAKLSSFVRVLRALDLLEALDRLLPEPVPSPNELLKLHGKHRKRAAPVRDDRLDESTPWTWGDRNDDKP